MLVDTHCHLDFPEFDQDRDAVVRLAKEQGIEYIINIGSSVKGSIKSLELSRKYPGVYAAIGIHPHEADSFVQKDEEALRKLAREEKVVAIGEIGLDYFKNFSKPDGSTPLTIGPEWNRRTENQRFLFISLINLAKNLNLPLVIHTRQAEADTLKILKENMPLEAVVHCFSGESNFLKECLDLGFLVSFTCNITYKKAQNLRDIVRLTPIDRLLLETDAPYLSPEGFRGKRNEPLQVKLLAKEVARIKGMSLEEVAGKTTANAMKFFNLK